MDFNMSELIRCHKCREYYELNYTNDQVISQTRCKCIKRSNLIDGMKPLDYFTKNYFKQGGKNEAINRGINQISKTSKDNPKE
jgi:hypothetical protein